MNDAELLAALAGRRAPGSVYAVALAQRAHPEATTPEVVTITGFSRTQVYEARALLDEHAPGWRGEQVPEAVPVSTPPVTPPGPESGDGTGLATVEKAVPLWRVALAEAVEAVNPNGTARSWDAYADFYAPAADRCIAEAAGPAELIALTVDYFETITGDRCEKRQRGQIAKLVHSHGKTALYGVKQALMCGDVDLDDQSALIRYAQVVCSNTVTELRGRTNGQ